MKVRQTAAEDDCNIIQPREPDGAVGVSSRDLAVENVCKGANEVGELLELDMFTVDLWYQRGISGNGDREVQLVSDDVAVRSWSAEMVEVHGLASCKAG